MLLGSGDLLSQVTSKTSSPRHWDLLVQRTSVYAAHMEEKAGDAAGANILVPPGQSPQSVVWQEEAPSPCHPTPHHAYFLLLHSAGLVQAVSSALVSPPGRTMLIPPCAACLPFLWEAPRLELCSPHTPLTAFAALCWHQLWPGAA